MSEYISTEKERIDRVCTDVAIMAAMMGEMSKRLDTQSGSISTLNHNSTQIQISIARLEATAATNKDLIVSNKELIEDMKDEFSNSLKTWLTVFGIIMSVVTFIINYYKV